MPGYSYSPAYFMFIYKSKVGAVGAGLYLFLVLVAAIIPYVAHSSELGMIVTSFTFPWSLLSVILVNPFLSEAALKSEAIGLSICAVSALINAAIIYTVLGFINKGVGHKQAFR